MFTVSNSIDTISRFITYYYCHRNCVWEKRWAAPSSTSWRLACIKYLHQIPMYSVSMYPIPTHHIPTYFILTYSVPIMIITIIIITTTIIISHHQFLSLSIAHFIVLPLPKTHSNHHQHSSLQNKYITSSNPHLILLSIKITEKSPVSHHVCSYWSKFPPLITSFNACAVVKQVLHPAHSPSRHFHDLPLSITC